MSEIVALIPGTFNPLHAGHTKIAWYCMLKSEIPVFCIALNPYDKENVPSAVERSKQFDNKYVKLIVEPRSINGILLYCRALWAIQHDGWYPLFTINIGVDTFVRVIDQSYYPDDEHYESFVDNLRKTNTILRVFPRNGIKTVEVPEVFQGLVQFATDYEEVDISSTQIREAMKNGK